MAFLTSPLKSKRNTLPEGITPEKLLEGYKSLGVEKLGGFKNAFLGRPEEFEQQNLLSAQQQPILSQQVAAARGPGAPGAAGEAADYYRSLLGNEATDYYRNLLSDENPDLQAQQAPEFRNFYEDILPDIAEQYAGMGSGALSSSGFRNAAVQAGAGLSERLAQIRANLRQSGAQNLSNLGVTGAQGLQATTNAALGNYTQNLHRPEQTGFLQNVAEGTGRAVGEAIPNFIRGGGGGGGAQGISNFRINAPNSSIAQQAQNIRA